MNTQMEDGPKHGLEVVLGIQKTPVPNGEHSHNLSYSYDRLTSNDIRPLLEAQGVKITPVDPALYPIIKKLNYMGEKVDITHAHALEGSYDDMDTTGILLLDVTSTVHEPTQTLVFYNFAKDLENAGALLPKQKETILTSTIEKTATFYAIQSTLINGSIKEAEGGFKQRYIDELDTLRTVAVKLVQELKSEITISPTAWIQMGVIPNIPEEELLPLIYPENATDLDHFTRAYYNLAQFFHKKYEKMQQEDQ